MQKIQMGTERVEGESKKITIWVNSDYHKHAHGTVFSSLITEMNSRSRIFWYIGPNASREYVWKDSICQIIICVPCSRVLCGKYL